MSMTESVHSDDLMPLMVQLVGGRNMSTHEALTALKEAREGKRKLPKRLRQSLEALGMLEGE